MTNVREWLRERGTESVTHPGGTLYAHLCRVEERLAGIGHDAGVQAAGLTHAAYGTDGFDLALVFWQDRLTLSELIGPDAEELVYLYGACDRKKSWPELAATHRVTDRFTGGVTRLADWQVTPFVDLSVVNELDVLEHDAASLAAHRDYFTELFAAWEPVMSPAVATEVARLFRS
ncbi:DUF6817 domain-containing protein [Actinoplanes derwentensis]|uniref:DUF6817 domain-containing protein n=1 Tax=Actinoplanes derwentensis TaxID=113562 RepID=A0A1H1TYW4_9ACTN|nr:hypothetical protein [Actinoplanes derwentensis]GID89878.1 hypothetical protein Ade03nite_88020 [Actinoplanes derwentensis]SDS64789.1 hypothetical protein SAMN04489716_1268 [Actinoplanes derwentensis]